MAIPGNSISIEKNPWIAGCVANPGAQLRLFCFPYAGGAAMTYRGWAGGLPDFIEVCPVQLPGRSNRLNEPAFTNLLELSSAIVDGLWPLFDKPFALFGHSMGAIIGFEIGRILRRRNGREPLHLFVSCSPSPQIRDRFPITYNLPDAEFKDELRRLNGTPPDVLDHPELMELVMPLLRADFEVVQTYFYEPGLPLRCPITAFGGLQDKEVDREMLEGWQAMTQSSFALRFMPGDHFFLQTQQRALLSIIAQELSRNYSTAI